MQKLLIIFFLFPLFSFSQSWQWVRREGGTQQDCNGLAICTDDAGNCYTVADSGGHGKMFKYNNVGNKVWSINCAEPSSYPLFNPASNSLIHNAGYLYLAGDSSIAKYDTSGTLIWIKNVGGHCKGVSIDNSNNIYIMGNFIQKRDSAGNLIWSQNIKAVCNSIFTDGPGNCYLTGKFGFNAVFGSDTLTARGSSDVFVAKYDSSGNCLWARRAGGNHTCCYSLDMGNAITSDQTGNIYDTGSFVDTADFGSITLHANSNDVFLAKYDMNGNVIWVQQGSGGSDQEGRCIAIDYQGNILVGGSYVPTCFFNGFPLTGWGGQTYDAFVAKYDSSGNFVNVIKAGGTAWNEFVYGIIIDNSGNNFVTGSFSGTTYFGTDSLISLGGFNIFIAKISLVTGIEENTNGIYNLNISPNPTRSHITITTSSFTNSILSVYDITGRILLQQKFNEQATINVAAFKEGMYLVEVRDEKGRSVKGKLVKV